MAAQPPHHANYGPSPAILLTNDDGIHPEKALILPLARRLVTLGHDVVVCAPGANNSACAQRITLGAYMTMRRHPDYERRFAALPDAPVAPGSLRVYSIDEGTPADCVIAAIQPRAGLLAHLGVWPRLAVSAVNYGQNLGSDVIYSGTFAAARQAAMYGIPAIASSLDLFKVDDANPAHVNACERAIQGTVEVTLAALAALPHLPHDAGRLNPKPMPAATARLRADEKLKDAFGRGDIVLNLNVPVEWKGEFQTTRLDSVMYHSAISLPYAPTGVPGDDEETLLVKLSSSPPEYMYAYRSDTNAVRVDKVASLTPVSTWPLSHPLALPDSVFDDAVRQGLTWLPATSRVRMSDKL